jgi:hypothetical protein
MKFLEQGIMEKPLSVRGAIQKIKGWQMKETKKVAHAVALQSAKVKYAVNQLQILTMYQSESWVDSMVKELTPPMQEEKLLQYAQTANQTFEKKWSFLLDKLAEKNAKNSGKIKEYKKEIEETLENIRRMVVQNLSHHPANKPLILLEELDQTYLNQRDIKNESVRIRQQISDLQNQISLLQEQIESLKQTPDYETVLKLAQSRESLLQKKKALETKWNASWEKISSVFYLLQEKTKTFEKMENAQMRWLQLYLANPLRARVRDPSGQALFMLLNLAAEALGEDDSKLSKEETERSRKTLIATLENNDLEDFFWKSNKLEVALNANAKEYFQHPLYAQETEWKRMQRGLVGEYQKIAYRKEQLSAKLEELNSAVNSLEKEAMVSCKTVLGIKLDLENG